MKTILALLCVAFIGTVLTLIFWAAKNYIREIRREKDRIKNCQKSLTLTDKKL